MLLSMFVCCYSKQGNKKIPVSSFSNTRFLFGLKQDRNYERQICEHWNYAGLTVSYEHFYIFYATIFDEFLI